MKLTVELIYDSDCPNVAEARAALLQAFAGIGLPAVWKEWDRTGPGSPEYVLYYGSPTILVNGRDVEGLRADKQVRCCRLYAGEAGQPRRTPSSQKIASALREAAHANPS